MDTKSHRHDAPGVTRSTRLLRGVRVALRLVRPFWLRELRDRRLVGLIALSAVAAIGTTAYAYAFETGQATGQNDTVRQVVLVTGGFRSTMGAVFAVVAILLPIDRLTSIRRSGWWIPLVACGAPPASIALGAAFTIACVVQAGFAVSYLLFAGFMTGLGLSAVHPLVDGYAGVAPALVAWTAFGALMALVARERNRALALAIAAVVVPSILITIWTVATDHPPPRWTIWSWALLTPLPAHIASWGMFAERVRYVACAALLAGLLSRRWLIPND